MPEGCHNSEKIRELGTYKTSNSKEKAKVKGRGEPLNSVLSFIIYFYYLDRALYAPFRTAVKICWCFNGKFTGIQARSWSVMFSFEESLF